MSDFKDVYAEHIRLSVLRLLDSQSGYCANDSVMTIGVQQLGLSCTRAQMREHLHWLEEVRMVTLLKPSDGLIVATLSERGADVANGRATTAGIARPSPRA
ncbi:MAG TPA: hypothetical protein VF463_10610 [Sphingobium sp.]